MVYTLVFRRYAPFSQFGGGFEGDSRTEGSVDPRASARTIGVVNFTETDVGSATGTSSGSTFVGLGAAVERAIGRHFSSVQASVAVATRSSSQLSFTARTAGANPLVPLAPRIVTIVEFSATFSPNAVTFAGAVRGDDFPNAEVIVYDVGAKALLLFDYQTTGGQTTGPFARLPSLPGGHDDQALGAFNRRVGLDRGGSFVLPSS
jgi:hypothetical protein